MTVPLSSGGGAAPPLVGRAVLPDSFPGNEAGPTLPALDLATEHISVGMPAAIVPLSIPLFQLGLDNIPQFPADDRLVVVADDHQLLLPVVVFFCVAQIVRGDGFFLYQIAHVFLVFQHLDDVSIGPFCVPGQRFVSRFPQFPGNNGSALLFYAVLVENELNQLRPCRIYCNVPPLYIIAQQRPAKHHSLLHPPGLAPLHPAGGLAALLLGHGAHDGQPKLRVRLQGVDAVVQEHYPHSQGFQLPGVGDGIQNVPGEPAHLFGEDELELSHMGVGDHAVECRTLFCGGAGDALVGVDLVQLPVRLAVDVFLEVALLALEGIGLVVPVGGHPAVGRRLHHGSSPLSSALLCFLMYPRS